MNTTTLPFALSLLMLWAPVRLFGQTEQVRQSPSVSAIESDLNQVEALLISFKNDSARMIAGQVIEELTRQQLLDTPLGLRAQLDEAVALEQGQDSEQAIAKLLRVAERCREKSLWDLSAKAALNLALLHERIGRGERSLEYLQETEGLIGRHGLDSIYPYYAVRMSSWQRIYGDKDSALYYAREALRTAPQFRLDLEEAIGHMLMNMLLPKDAVAHPDDLPHVFDRFFQTTRPDKPAEGGTGIGLALCHEYAHLFGGKIEVESTLGIGSVFRAVFPIVLSNEPLTQLPPNDRSLPTANRPLPTAHPAQGAATDDRTPPTDKPTILVVEDNPELQDYIRLILEEKYNVLTAGNGQAALDRLLPTAHSAQGAATANRPLHTAHRLPPTAHCQLPTAN